MKQCSQRLGYINVFREEKFSIVARCHVPGSCSRTNLYDLCWREQRATDDGFRVCYWGHVQKYDDLCPPQHEGVGYVVTLCEYVFTLTWLLCHANRVSRKSLQLVSLFSLSGLLIIRTLYFCILIRTFTRRIQNFIWLD